MKVKFHPKFHESMRKLFSSELRYSIPRWFSDTHFRIKMANQRVWREYDDSFIWNLNSHLAEFIPIALRQIIKEGYGHPGNFKNKKEWHKILDKMATGFESAGKIMDSEYMVKVKLKKAKKDIFGKMSKVSYKMDKRLYNKWQKEFDEGMKLFHKYFFNLWD